MGCLKLIYSISFITLISIVNCQIEIQANIENIKETNKINLKKRYSDNLYNSANDDRIHFPDSGVVQRFGRDNNEHTTLSPFNNYTEIPMDLIEKFNQITSIDDLYDEVIARETVDPRDQVAFQSRFGDVERSAAVVPRPASCIPEDTVVSLIPETDNKDPAVVYFPSCTRVKRCGGCCTHKLLSCQPTKKQTITYQVVKSKYIGGSKMAYAGKELVLIDEHSECKCDCVVQESDCNQFQRYDKSQCKCACTNLDDQNKCLRQNDIKIWDSSSCVCRCRESKECTTGSYFDQNQCRCLHIPPTGVSDKEIQDRRRFIIKAVALPPSNDGSKYTLAPFSN